MNWLIVSTILPFIAISVGEQYTDRYDYINVEEILENRKLLVPYVKCLLDQGRCTPEGKELKTHVQDGIQTGCSKCTDKQKQGSRKVVKHIKEHEQESWEQLKGKYDPGDKFKDVFERFLAAE